MFLQCVTTNVFYIPRNKKIICIYFKINVNLFVEK